MKSAKQWLEERLGPRDSEVMVQYVESLENEVKDLTSKLIEANKALGSITNTLRHTTNALELATDTIQNIGEHHAPSSS